MKFSKSVVVIAYALVVSQAFAQSETKAADANAGATTAVQTQPAQVQVTVQTQSTTSTTEKAVETKAADVKASEVKAVDVKGLEKKEDVSKAEALKKARQETEAKNDSKVVEKLEQTRLEEEKSLAEKIDNTNLKDEKKEVAPVAPIVVIQPAQEKVAAVEDEKNEEQNTDKWFVGLGIGGLQYSSGNVTNKSSYTFSVGTIIDDRLILEGSIGITNLNTVAFFADSYFNQVEQYDVAFAGKYILSNTGKFRPFVGADIDYIMRNYKDRAYYGDIYYMYDNYTTGLTTNAINAGILAGGDFQVAKQFLIGGQIKYSFNIYRQRDQFNQGGIIFGSIRPIEETSFTSYLLSVKFLF